MVLVNLSHFPELATLSASLFWDKLWFIAVMCLKNESFAKIALSLVG